MSAFGHRPRRNPNRSRNHTDPAGIAASNPVEFSAGVLAAPAAPLLAVSTADQVARLAWTAAATGPAAEAYQVEAAPAGATAFVPMARVGGQELFVKDVPIGTWRVRVRATTSGGAGTASNVVTLISAACSAPPPAPTGLFSVAFGPAVTLRWLLPTGAGPPAYVAEAGWSGGASDLGRFTLSGPTRSINSRRRRVCISSASAR